jgi:hypothetical protein
MKLLSGFLVIFLFSSNIFLAQENTGISIKGRVLDEETGAPLENANVFLAGTTFGTSTDKSGNYIIKKIPYGTYDIIFSFVGYGIQKRKISSYKSEIFILEISLKPKAVNLNQINVTASVPEDWKENLKIFTKIFIGETENSRKTKILNPEVLNFQKEESSNILKAYSDSTIKVENRALGYMLYINLDSLEYDPDKTVEYTLYPRFKELSPATYKEKIVWEKNREKTYINSERYFFYALVHKELEKDFFSLHEGPGMGSISGKNLNLTCDEDSTLYTLNFMGDLEVRRFQGPSSFLNFLYSFVTIDKFGNLINYFPAVKTSGYWADQRIADLLPLNYVYHEN